MVAQQPQQQYDPENFIPKDNSGLYQESEKELLNIIVSVKDAMENFEHITLKGEYSEQDPNLGIVWKKHKGHRPIINDIGIAEIKAALSGIVNEKTPISYISEEDFYKEMFYFDMSVAEMFGKRCDVWDLDQEMAKTLKDAMINLARTVLSMSKEGFTAINFKTQYQKHDIQRNESANQNDSQKTIFGIKVGGR